jgi:nucleotide-binding universal stress UspA family protein
MASILVPLDFSDVSRTALPIAREHARRNNAAIVLMLVAELPETAVQGDEADAQKRRIVHEAMRELDGIAVRYRSEDSASPAQAILDAIADEDVAEVVIADAGRTAGSQVARDRVINEVRANTNVPITVVRAEEKAPLA